MATTTKKAPSIKALPGPEDIHRKILDNGIVVLTRSNFNSPSIAVSGYISAGSLSETDDKLGLSDFVASSLMRGTQKHSFDEIFNELESVGATIGYDSGVHKTGFGGRALVEDLPLILDLISETMREPAFPENEIEKLRTQLLTGLSIRAQDTSDMANMLYDEILYQDHPYSRPDDGTPETIKAITRTDLMEFHRNQFGPKGMVIVIIGAIEAKKAVSQVERVFGGWQVPAQKEALQLPEYKPLKKTTKRHHPINGKSQADLVIGTIGPRRKDDDYFAATLGNSVLGQFGMMGRIGASVREKAGLAYYAYSGLSSGANGPGSWDVSAGVNPKNLDKAIDLIIKELARFTKGGVTKEELADCKANFIGRLPLSMESNSGVAGALLNIERHDLGLDYYLKYADMVNAVMREDVLAVARKFIDVDKLAIATAGP